MVGSIGGLGLRRGRRSRKTVSKEKDGRGRQHEDF
jgi:hypothetical protein